MKSYEHTSNRYTHANWRNTDAYSKPYNVRCKSYRYDLIWHRDYIGIGCDCQPSNYSYRVPQEENPQ